MAFRVLRMMQKPLVFKAKHTLAAHRKTIAVAQRFSMGISCFQHFLMKKHAKSSGF